MRMHMGHALAGVVLLAAVFLSTAKDASSADPLPVATPLVIDVAYRWTTDRVGRNETLTHLFGRHEIGGRDLYGLLRSTREDGLDPRRVQRNMTFDFRYRVGDPLPDRIRTRLRDDAYLLVERDPSGDWTSQLEPIEWNVTVHRVVGTIESSLNEAIHRAVADSVLPFAERDRLIWNTAEAVYGWVIDFTRDIRPGDDFQILYERLTSDAGDVQYGRVLAAQVETQGRMNTAYVVTGEHGNNVYYDDTGRSLHRAFLKYPVQFRRISSVFTRRRFHPVLRIYRAHLGYDFAADIGTPVRATGDGVIIRANRNGGYGLMVSIRHPKGFETRYAHMSRIARGKRPGVRVTQGETIGYVGMTGLANGPHVHYEFLRNGRHINYRNVDLGDGEPLPASLEAEFAVQRAEFERMLAERKPRIPTLLGGAE